MNCYSFRAECLPDVLAFLKRLCDCHIVGGFTATRVAGFPDMECAVETVATMAQLYRAAEQCEDCHRIRETLALLPTPPLPGATDPRPAG